MTDTNTLAPTNADIIALADETRTGEPGRDGYILPISFARAVLAKWGAPAPASSESAAPSDDSKKRWMQIADQRALEVAALELEIVRLRADPALVSWDPLTDEQLLAALASITHEVPSRLPAGWAKFARAIESAHGITAAPKGGQHAE